MGRQFVRGLFLVLLSFNLWVTDAQANRNGTTLSQLAAAGVGNGEVYAGGDFLERRLTTAREKLNQSLSLLRSGFDVENLCGGNCLASGEASLCQALRRMNASQQDSCRKFIVTHASTIERMNSPSQVSFQLSQIPLLLPGSRRPISAMTKPREKEPIIFHYGSIANVSFEALIALIAHELGHKIQIENDMVILDDKPVPGFAHGREFLDAVGAALAVYSGKHSAPSQVPPALTFDGDVKQLCALGTDSQAKFLVGLALDTSGTLPSSDMISSWRESINGSGPEKSLLAHAQQMVSGADARKEVVKKLFRKYLLRAPSEDELSMMVERLAAGVPYEAIVASLLGDDEYSASRGAKAPNQFISAAFLDLVGRTPSFEETKSMLKVLDKMDRASVALNIMKIEMVGWKRWLTEWYLELYNRSPKESEVSDHLVRLRSGSGWESVKAHLLSTPEYFTLQTARWPGCSGKTRGLAAIEDSRRDP